MDYLQLIFSLFNAPLFAVFLLGMFTRWATPTAGFCGLLCGLFASSLHSFAVRSGIITYGSPLLGDFYGAIYAWVTTVVVVTLVSQFTQPKSQQDLHGITYFTDREARPRISPLTWTLAAAVLIACICLNVIFR